MAVGDLGIGFIKVVFHINGNSPSVMQLLNRSQRGLLREYATIFSTLPGIPSGPGLFIGSV
jgi:hypothetical protein